MKNLIYISIALFFFSKSLNALVFNEDSLKSKYDLNDPRNPNCPCHKYQKLADEEFEKLNKDFSEQKTNFTKTQFSGVVTGSSASRSNNAKHFRKKIFSHHKNRTYNFFDFIKCHPGKKKHHIRTNKNINSCFSWK